MKKYGKKNLFKSLVGICMSLCVVLLVSMTGYAADLGDSDGSQIAPMSLDAKKGCSLSISSGTATAATIVRGTSGQITKISIQMELQKKMASGSYTTVKTWSGSKSSSSYTLKRTKTVSKGTYRVKSTITCYDGSKSERTTIFSSVKTY